MPRDDLNLTISRAEELERSLRLAVDQTRVRSLIGFGRIFALIDAVRMLIVLVKSASELIDRIRTLLDEAKPERIADDPLVATLFSRYNSAKMGLDEEASSALQGLTRDRYSLRELSALDGEAEPAAAVEGEAGKAVRTIGTADDAEKAGLLTCTVHSVWWHPNAGERCPMCLLEQRLEQRDRDLGPAT